MGSDVSVVIVNWHSEEMLSTALAALRSQTMLPDRVIIVDNGSDGEIPVSRYDRGDIITISMPGNVGFAAANNRAIAEAVETRWVALLNPDAVPDATWLENLMRAAACHPGVQAFGSMQLMSSNHRLIDGLGDVYHASGAAWRNGHGRRLADRTVRIENIFSPCAAAALYRRDAFLEVGGFDEDFFCYFEDVDLGFRMRLLGYTSMLVTDAVVYHIGSATSGGRRSDFSVYHGHRNLVWAYFKNMPSPYLWLYLPQHLAFNLVSILIFAARGQGRAILRAKWNALLGLPRMLRKRTLIQTRRRTPPRAVLEAMLSGWLAPYRRTLDPGRWG